MAKVAMIAAAFLVLASAAHAKVGEPGFDRHDPRGFGQIEIPKAGPVKQARAKTKKPAPAKRTAKAESAPVAKAIAEKPAAEDSGLVEKARQFLGTNPTGWARLWCGRFMAMIAPDLAAKVKNPNWARAWASLPRTVAKVGVIVVLTRGAKGGHIGVVSGFDNRGNPRVVSGNHNRKVAEAVYSKRRVIAYVGGG